MKMRITLVAIPLLIVSGVGILIWRMAARQRAEARYHANLSRSIQLSSDAFEDQADIPAQFTCEGEQISPPLAWSYLPQGTRSLILMMTDEDLPTPHLSLFKIVHWVVYNIPGEITELERDVSDAQLKQWNVAVGPNWTREARYYPPCPVSGRHRYVFRLYALDTDAIHPQPDNRRGVLQAMEKHILGYGELSGFYEK